jgi:GNAT superfamily N-acetyltransferase
VNETDERRRPLTLLWSFAVLDPPALKCRSTARSPMATRAKTKKEQIRQETELLNRKRAQMAACESIEDVLSEAPFFKSFKGRDLRATLVAARKCPEEFLDSAFQLVETHMKAIYEDTWGWKPEAKEAELSAEAARFIFAFVEEQPYPIAFIHYQFELTKAELSSVVYDIHVGEAFQRKGLGKFMLQALEIVSLRLKLDSVQVTLFKANAAGRQFFRKMKYTLHSMSPALVDPESEHEYNHEILFKSLVKKT